jgi:hypothetical protein
MRVEGLMDEVRKDIRTTTPRAIRIQFSSAEKKKKKKDENFEMKNQNVGKIVHGDLCQCFTFYLVGGAKLPFFKKKKLRSISWVFCFCSFPQIDSRVWGLGWRFRRDCLCGVQTRTRIRSD